MPNGLILWSAAALVPAVLAASPLALRSLSAGPVSRATRTPRGVVGRVLRDIEAHGGVIEVDGEVWLATAEGGPIAAGEWVRTVGHEGTTIHVAPLVALPDVPPPDLLSSRGRGQRLASRPAGWGNDPAAPGRGPRRACPSPSGETGGEDHGRLV